MTTTISNNPVTFRVIVPKPLQANSMDAAIRDAVIKDAKAMGKDFEAVIRTWKSDKPRIQTEAKLTPAGTAPGTGIHNVYTASAWPKNDGSRGYWKWIWLDLGTKVRYAVMTNPFVAKTRPGMLKSYVGKGHMLFVSKKHPMPGIKKRQFTVALRKKWEQPFKQHMKDAVAKARKLSGHAI